MRRPWANDGSTTSSTVEYWTGQEDLAWNILLVASLRETPTAAVLRDRLRTLAAENGWSRPSDDAVILGEVNPLLETLGAAVDPAQPVSVGLSPAGLVVRANHAYVDGLGLLAVLRELTGAEVRSAAAGIGDRSRGSTVGALASRLVEVVLRPPVSVAESAPSKDQTADVFAVATVERPVRASEVAHAALQAVAASNAVAGARSDRLALAIGVSTVGGADLRVGEDSGFLRITDAQRLDRAQLDRALADAPLQVGGTARGRTMKRASGLIRWASRTFASRLGSTVLVSHLSRVASDALTDVAFYPLAGGGSGLSLGAVTLNDRTTVTLRARGRQHNNAELQRLLLDVVERLN